MKKIVLLLTIFALSISLLAGCTSPQANQPAPAQEAEKQEEAKLQTLKVGATPVPHSEMLEFVKPLLFEKGIELQIIEFTDYVTPNLALNDKGIDANFFQHVPYMNTFAENNNLKLSAVAKVHVEPLGLYSKKLSSVEDLKDGARIAIPNDPTNGGRALLLLQNYGLIELPANAPLTVTEKDITSNPKNLRFIPLEAPQLPRALDDVDASVINTNYALEAGLNPASDALLLEDANSPYANVLTVRPEDESNANIQALVEVLNSAEVKEFIETNYKGAIVPAF